MKRLICLLTLTLLTVIAMAQERTVTKNIGSDTRWDYTGTSADTLIETNQDTIDFRIEYRGAESIEKLDIFTQWDSLAGNDSIYVSVLGYKDLSGAATTLIARTGVLINKSNLVKELTLYQTVQADSTATAIKYTPVDLSYRYYLIRCIQDDNNDYDGGAKLDYFRFKIYKK